MAINVFRWSTRVATAFALLTYFVRCSHCVTAKRRPNGTLHKVTLSRGDVQFIEFDMDVPPLKEFTFCMWVRTLDDAFEQPLFAYSVDRYREVEVWLEPGGGLVAVAVRGRAAWVPVRAQREWRHFCVSWHGGEGAWALYEDATLVTCFEDDTLVGAVLPRGGKISIGQGNPSRGSNKGIEADIFGFNMITGSTINSALTIYDQPDYEHLDDHTAGSTTTTTAHENKHDSFYRKMYRYVVLDAVTEHTKKGKKKTHKKKKPKNNITAHLAIIPPYLMHLRNRTEDKSRSVDIASTQTENKVTSKPQNMFWNLVRKPGRLDLNFDAASTIHVLEYETPPPSEIMPLSFISDFETPPSVTNDYFLKDVEHIRQPMEARPSPLSLPATSAPPHGTGTATLATIETPPPITEQSKVFGQWASISFSDSVLNSIKKYNINTRSPQKVVPKTIPLYKISDSFPYTSELKPTFAVPPKSFHRERNIFAIRQRRLKKRDLNRGETNLQITNEQKPQKYPIVPMVSIASVEVSSRGVSKDAVGNNWPTTENRGEFLPTNGSTADSMSDFSNLYALHYSEFQPKPFQLPEYRLQNHNLQSNGTSSKARPPDSERYEAAYARMHFKGNMWHQPKPKRIHIPRMESGAETAPITVKAPEPEMMSTLDIWQMKSANPAKNYMKKYVDVIQTIKNRYNTTENEDKKKQMELENDEGENENVIHIGGKLRRTLPDESKDAVWSGEADAVPVRLESKSSQDTNEFKKTVKLGNALNEKQIFSLHGDSRRDTFLGSNKRVPEINRYRSDLDGVNHGNVPPSLVGRKCRSRERKPEPRLKYHSDGSVGSQGLASAALRLIEASYQGCTERRGSVMADLNISLVAWSKTPMRIFGGAEISITEPPCYSIYVN